MPRKKKVVDAALAAINQRKQATYRTRKRLFQEAVNAVLQASTLEQAQEVCRAAVEWKPTREKDPAR